MTGIPLKVDGRGRVSLGKAFAHRLVLVSKVSEDCVQIELAEAVPTKEAWLHKNRTAMESVMRGLTQTGQGEFAQPPNLEADDSDTHPAKDK